MSKTVGAVALLIGCALMCSPALADGLEPETGVFADNGPPEPYELALRDTLLGDDNYRLCQMLTVPSWWAESAVYMVKQPDGSATVVSRALKFHLWPKMLETIERMSSDPNGYSLGPAAQRAALGRLHPEAETRTATLDAAATTVLLDTCYSVLLQVRYPETPSSGFDGTRYHAGHWVPGRFLSGTTWSPKDGTIAAEFVAMEDALAAFARSEPEQRDAMRADLLEKATRLRDRVARQ